MLYAKIFIILFARVCILSVLLHIEVIKQPLNHLWNSAEGTNDVSQLLNKIAVKD